MMIDVFENLPDDYYVYVYLDPRKSGRFVYGPYEFDYEPFYVGKGCKNRDKCHLESYHLNNDTNKYKVNKIKKIIKETNQNPTIFRLKENLFEKDALDLETDVISKIGRIDLKTGPLTNITNGGDGVSGRIVSEDERIKASQRMKLRLDIKLPKSEEHKKKIKESNLGLKRSEETRRKIAEVQKGKPGKRLGMKNSPENRIRHSSLMKEMWKNENYRNTLSEVHTKYRYYLCFENFLKEITNFKIFCDINNINKNSINSAMRKNKAHKGFLIKRILKEDLTNA